MLRGKRNPPGFRVTTRKGVPKPKGSKSLAQTYMSEPVQRKPVKQYNRSSTPEQQVVKKKKPKSHLMNASTGINDL